MSDVVSKLWGFCHTLRHDGIDYGDYIEQITYLLFLKMADERGIDLPDQCDWSHLKSLSGTDLTDEYPQMLRELGKQSGILGDIFSGAQSRFTNPVNLRKLITLIDETEWTSLEVDVKAEAFEGLLEKAANEGKKGAGQYFTPRLLIQSMMRCIKPDPRTKADFTIGDPACGTGGFLVGAYEWLKEEMKKDGKAVDRDTDRRIKQRTYFGQELVARPRRLALMNLYLHNVSPHIELGDSIYEVYSGPKFDVVVTNPPFGNRGANQVPEREDFTIPTSNKQLNFLQHILTILKPGGRAAVVVPDNVLFADKAGEVFKILMQDCDVHTIMRHPRGTFTPYTQGTKTYSIFFTKGKPTKQVWVYDGRANVPGITKKDRPLSRAHFEDFERCYGDDPNGASPRTETDRFRCFSLEDVKKREYKLDGFKWIKDESLDDADDLAEPEEIIGEAVTQLTAAIGELNEVLKLLEKPERVEA